MSKSRPSWLKILGLIFSFAPIVGAFVIIFEVLPPEPTNTATVLITIVGIAVCSIALAGSRLGDFVNKGAQVATLGLVIGGFLFVAYGITIPGYIAMRYRAREYDVKVVAHSLQTAVEDYKKTPERRGLKPGSSIELGYVVAVFLPENVLMKVNPFDKTQLYGVVVSSSGNNPNQDPPFFVLDERGKQYLVPKKLAPTLDAAKKFGAGGIAFGSPGGHGQIGYIFTGPNKHYQIVALGRDGTPILTLKEEP